MIAKGFGERFLKHGSQRLSRRVLCPLYLFACLFGSTAAIAEGDLRISGFGTLGYAADDRTDIATTRDIGQLPSNNYRTGPTWKLDSRLGVQIEYKPNAMIDLVGQVVLRDHFRASANSSTELAYVALHPDTDVDLRAGRLNYDAFLMSDHRNVGYAYSWVRPPLEFYGWIPIFSLDGVDAAYTMRDDDVRYRFKAQAGKSKFWIPVGSGIDGGYQFRANDLFSLSLTRQSEFWRLKVSHSGFLSSNEVPLFAPLHAGLDQVAAAGIPGVSAEAADLRRNLSFKGARISYTTLGAVYDDNTWLVQGELGLSRASADVVPASRMAYVSVGRRFGDWMPFAMWSVSRPDKGLHGAGNNWGGLNGLRDTALQLVDALRIDQETLSIGARWDFHPQAALKLQLDSTHSHPPGFGVWNMSSGASVRSNRFNLLSVTLDFAF